MKHSFAELTICAVLCLSATMIVLTSCGLLDNVGSIAELSREAQPVIDAGKKIGEEISKDGPRDWAGILENGAYIFGVASAIAGGEVLRRRRKRKLENTNA